MFTKPSAARYHAGKSWLQTPANIAVFDNFINQGKVHVIWKAS